MTNQAIAVRHRIEILPFLFPALIMFGLSGAVLVTAHRQLLQAEPSHLIWTIYMLLALAFGIGIATLVALRDREKMHWSLSAEELVGGWKHPVRIPLSSIVSISEGVPARAGIGSNNPWRKSGIVLKTKDNRILALNLANSAEGAQLMGALIERCSAVFTTDPSFTVAELAVLHRLTWNRVIDTVSGRPM